MAPRIVAVLGWIVAALLATMLSFAAFIHAPWGASRLADPVERLLSAQLQGDLQIGALSVSPWGLRATRVLIVDHRKRPVIAATEVDVALDPLALLVGRIHVEELVIRGGLVEVAYDPKIDDVTVGHAFAPAAPRAGPSKQTGPPGPLPPVPPLPIQVDRLVVYGAAFRLALTPDAPPDIVARDISAEIGGSWSRRAQVKIDLIGRTLVPLEAPLAVHISGSFADEMLAAPEIAITIGGTHLRAKGLGQMRALDGNVQLEAIAGTAEARAFGIPLAEPVYVVADIGLSTERIGGDVRASIPGRGVVVADASLSPRDGTTSAHGTLETLDPEAWLSGLPAGRLSGAISVTGRLAPESGIDVDLSVARGLLAGTAFGPARLRGALSGDRIRIDDGTVQFAGSSLSFSGSMAPEAIDLDAELHAQDLAAMARLLAGAGLELPPLGGTSTLRIHAAGPPERPTLNVRVDAPRLRVGEVQAVGLHLQGTGRPGKGALPALELSGEARSLEAGRFRASSLRLFASRRDDGAFHLRAESHGPYQLEADGTLVPDRAVVERFHVRYPEAELHLASPMTVEARDGVVAIRNLHLLGPGRIEGHVVFGPRHLDIDLVAEALRLDRLPQALLPGELSGTVDLRARLDGPRRRPVGRVRLRLSDGRYGSIVGLAASGVARLDAGRATGRLAIRLRDAGEVRGSFDVPVDPLGAPASTPIRLDLLGSALELSAIGEALGAHLPAGTLHLRLAGSGTVGTPNLRLESQLLDVRLPESALPGADAAINLELERGRVSVDIEGRVVGRRVLRLDAALPFDLRRFVGDPQREVERIVRAKSVRIDAEARGLDLAFLAQPLEEPNVTGPVAAVVDLRGPLIDPRGEVQVDVAARSLLGFDRVEGKVAAELGDRRTHIDGQVAIDGGRPSSFGGSVDAPLLALLDGTARAVTPVTLRFDIPELRLRRYAGAPDANRAAERRSRRRAGLPPPIPSSEQVRSVGRLAGTVAGGGRFEGTLARLEGGLRVMGRNLSVGGVRLGDAEISVRQDEALEARLDAIDPTGGTLAVTARVGGRVAPLGLLHDPLLEIERFPLSVIVDGSALSLAPLRIVPGVVAASGTASIDLRGKGARGRIQPVGRFVIDGGRVELASGQILEGLETLATFEGDRLELRKLTVRTPDRGQLDARGSWTFAGGADPLVLVVHAEDFPISGPGGVLARATGTANVEGRLGRKEGLDARVGIPELNVAVPQRPPRDIQPVGRHRDVAIVTGPEAERRIRKNRTQHETLAFPVTASVDAPDVRVRGEDVDARLSAALTLRRDADAEFLARGSIRSERSEVRVLGRRFEVERATARFDGPLERPFVDATARYEALEATAWVDVSGFPDGLQVRLRSDPPLPESQIAVLIASGQIPEAREARVGTPGPVGERAPPEEAVAAGGAAASIAGSFLAGRLRGMVGPLLPLDVLVLETGREGGTRLEAGTFFGERLYVGYLRDLLPGQGQNLNEIRAEYRLGRSFSLQSFFGDAATGGVDLVFDRSVPTGRQQAARREAAAGRATHGDESG